MRTIKSTQLKYTRVLCDDSSFFFMWNGVQSDHPTFVHSDNDNNNNDNNNDNNNSNNNSSSHIFNRVL